jgi:Tol biopolymer transport system component
VALTQGGASFPTTMTTDGHYVGFVGSLSPGAASNLFMWDSQISARVYTNTNNAVLALALSSDGQTLFLGTATGLYAIDRIANTSTLLATNPLASRFGLHLSANGRFLAYAAASGTNNQIYAYDFQIGTNLLVSKNFGSGTNGFGNSDTPDISADGRYIAYRSFAEDIVPGDTNRLTDLFLYDQQTGASSSVNVGTLGAADHQSRSPLFSSDGQFLILRALLRT